MADFPYFLRSKRRRLNMDGEDVSFGCIPQENVSTRRKNPIIHLPTEVLVVLLKNLSYRDLAKNVRCVNRRFKTVAEDILNKGFQSLERRLVAIKIETMRCLNTTSDPREVRFRCRLLNVVENLMFYYELIMATIWRYVYTPEAKMCMYAGEILDNYVIFLTKFTKKHRDFYAIRKPRRYRDVPWIVHGIKNQTKLFCSHFENVTEMPINTISKSGSKLLDILNTDRYTKQTNHEEWFEGKKYYCKLNYYFSYSWFAAIESLGTRVKKMDWKEHQKYMYMRLRRLVIAHTEIQMNEFQYLREYERLQNTLFVIPRPRSFMYTGYGEEENRFFFYGVMNQQCYSRRYPDEDQDFDFAVERDRFSSVSLYNERRLGVHIAITLKCPIRLAPRRVIRGYSKQKELKSNYKGVFDLKLNIFSPGNAQIRVPEHFRFVVKGNNK